MAGVAFILLGFVVLLLICLLVGLGRCLHTREVGKMSSMVERARLASAASFERLNPMVRGAHFGR